MKNKEVAPDWAGIAAAREQEIADLRGELQEARVGRRIAEDAFDELDEKIMRVEDALSGIEPQCHRRDVRGAEVVTLVREALGGGKDE